MIPPNSKGVHNKNALYAIYLDSASCVCPSDCFLIYLTTETEIQGGEPEGTGSSLSDGESVDSVWDRFVSNNSERLCGEMDRAISVLTATSSSSSSASSFSSSSSSTSSPSSSCSASDDSNSDSSFRSRIICSATTIRPLYHPSALKTLDPHSLSPLPSNVVLCGDTSSSIAMESEVEQAKEIFHILFPGADFLPPLLEKEDEDGNEYGNETENGGETKNGNQSGNGNETESGNQGDDGNGNGNGNENRNKNINENENENRVVD